MSLYLNDKKFGSVKLNGKSYTAAWLNGVKYPLRSSLEYQWASDYVVPEANWKPFYEGTYAFPSGDASDGGEWWLYIRSVDSPMIRIVMNGSDETYQWGLFDEDKSKYEGSVLPMARIDEYALTLNKPLIATLTDGSVVEVDVAANAAGNAATFTII